MWEQIKKRHFHIVLLGTLLFWRLGNDSLNSIYMCRLSILLMLLSIYFSFYVGSKLTYLVTPILASSFVSGIITSTWFERYSGEPFEIQAPLRQSSSLGTLILFVVAVFLIGRSYAYYNRFKSVIGASCIASSSVILAYVLLGNDISWRLPMFENPSMGLCYLVITLPFLYYFYKPIAYFYTLLILILMFVVKASSPFLSLAGVLLGYIICSRRWWLLIAGALVPVICLLIKPLSFWTFTNSRAHLWDIILHYWLNTGWVGILFGTGLSTTRLLTPIIQVANGYPINEGPWFFWLHNDWLQILFEQGIVGFFCFLLLVLALIKSTYRKDAIIFCSLLGYGFAMLTNFPMEFPPHMFLGFILVRLSLKDRK